MDDLIRSVARLVELCFETPPPCDHRKLKDKSIRLDRSENGRPLLLLIHGDRDFLLEAASGCNENIVMERNRSPTLGFYMITSAILIIPSSNIVLLQLIGEIAAIFQAGRRHFNCDEVI
jgi:hypothetical protein